MTNEKCYERGWIAAIDAICKMLRTEAEQCIKDIVPGDTIGAREATARCGALLIAESDAAVMLGKITMPQRDFIDITGGPDACRPQGERSET